MNLLNLGTGAEAMFADLGHFNKRSIQVVQPKTLPSSDFHQDSANSL